MMVQPRHTAENDKAWTEFDRHTPEAFWDVAIWPKGGTGWVCGSLDVAERKRIALAVLACTRDTPPTDEYPYAETEEQQ